MKTTISVFLGASLLSLAFTSCKSNEETEPNTGTVLIQTTVKNPDGTSGSSYIQLIPDFSKQTVGNSNSIQVGYSAGMRVYGNDIFITPEFGKDGTQELEKYSYTASHTLQKTGALLLPSMSGAYGVVKYNDEKAYTHLYNLGKILLFNPTTMTKTGEIDLTSYAFEDSNPDPSHPVIRDGLLYVPLLQIGSSWMPYPEYKQSDVVIIDISIDKVVKKISETASGMTFPVRPMNKDMIFTDENNDLYIACAGGFGLDPRFPETGFLCIPSGETEFDETRSWDISQTTIEGTSYKPGSLSFCKYIGNGKLCAYLTISELIGDNPYTSKYLIAALIDLKTKTIKKIDGIPATDGFSIFIDTYKDLAVFANYGDEQAGFFTYDPATGAVSDGPVVTTTGNPTFIYFFE
ncbi:MAG: hypothetical protein LBS07_03255 [Prevotellaceae bacterium]|jgi:hypothetical protein|nr:hypothetical protein [Prevotellaceae bacterium]